MKKLITMLLIFGCSLGLVACKTNDKKTQLEIPAELVVENQYISFKEVSNASYYNIYYDGNTWTVQPTYSGEVVIDASKIFTEIKTYEVKVKAIGTGKYIDSTYSSSVFYERTENLGIPNIKLNHDTLTWSHIDNATSYTIKVTFPDNTLGFYNYTSNTFDVRTVLNDVGTYLFQVKAGTDENSNYSTIATYIYNKKLSNPSNLSLSYDREENEIYLYFIADAETVSYTINVNDVNYELTDNLFATYGTNNGYSNYKKVKLLSFLNSQNSSIAEVKYFNVTVKANTSNISNYQNSDVSNKVSISLVDVLDVPVARLTTISNKTTLSWNNVSNAIAYNIYKNYNFYARVNSDITSFIFEESDLTNQILSVQAVGVDGKQNSPLSAPVYLSGMSSLPTISTNLTNTNIKFDNSINKYFVEVYNEDVYKSIEVEEEFLDIDLLDYVNWGKYSVKISCYKEGYIPKILNYTLNAKTLQKPLIKVSGYTLSWEEVPEAVGYAVKIKDTVVDKLFTTTKVDLTKYISTAGNYVVQVKAIADLSKNYNSSSWSEEETIIHTQQVETPTLHIEYSDGKYILKFNQVAGAYNYTILLNYIPVFEDDVDYKEEGYDITSYLTTAQEYTVMVKANANPNSIYVNSDYATISVKKYIQLDVINSDAMMVSNQEGKYWLNFATQTHAASYDVRIYHLEDEIERKIKITSVPYDITNYVQDSGTYKIYITAVASSENEYLYLSSAESGNPYILIKDRPTLDVVSGFTVGDKIAGNDKIIATWNKVDNADKYYLIISYTNNYDVNSKTKIIDEVYSTSESIDLAQFLLKEGQYTIKIKAISNGEYESTSFVSDTYNYRMTVDTDFMRNKVTFNGKTYSHYVTSYDELTNLLHYYYLYNDVNYYDENSSTNYKLKFMLDQNVTIDTLNAECEKINLGFTNPTEEGVTDEARMKKLAETAINSYSERVYFTPENPFSEPKQFSDNTTNYYLFNYSVGLSNNKVALEYTGKPLFVNSHSTIALQLRRNQNYIFNLELKDKLDVTTTEQLFMVVQSGYAPNFVGDYTTAKTVYDNAKVILNTICTDEMTDYEKVVAIYTWLISNVNYNYDFDKFMTLSNSLGMYTDESNTIRIGDVSYNYLESVFLNATSRISVSNGISKAFVLMCALEGIESVKVNGIKDGKYYYWNKVYLDCTPDNEENIKEWFVVDISGSYYSGLDLQDEEDVNFAISYNIGSYQYFMVNDTYMINTQNVAEKYNLKNAVSSSIHNYYASAIYEYLKEVTVSGEDGLKKEIYSGSGTLKYTGGQTIENYVKDILSYMVCNAKTDNKYLLEIDLGTENVTNVEVLLSDIRTNYAYSVANKFGISFKIAARHLNNKILIAISQIVT